MYYNIKELKTKLNCISIVTSCKQFQFIWNIFDSSLLSSLQQLQGKLKVVLFCFVSASFTLVQEAAVVGRTDHARCVPQRLVIVLPLSGSVASFEVTRVGGMFYE